MQNRTTLLDIVRKRSVPGILILDDRKNPIYFNPVAYGILHRLNGSPSSTFQKTDTMPAGKIPKEISDLYNNMKKNFNSFNSKESRTPALTALIPCHQKNYCCHGFFLDDPAVSYSKVPHVLMLLEKVSQHRQINLKSFKERFELTKRQMEILKLLGKGYSNKKIADELYIAEDTVKGHLKHIMKRLGVNTRTEILSMLFQPLILNGLEFPSTKNTRKMSSEHSGLSAEGIPSQK